MRVLAIAIAAAAMIAAVYAPVLGTETNRKSGTAAPNFGGSWMSVHERKFIPTGTGPMPVMDDPAHPHVARGRAANAAYRAAYPDFAPPPVTRISFAFTPSAASRRRP